jgi:KDO2-lipid IV(A) lauroyltransferase
VVVRHLPLFLIRGIGIFFGHLGWHVLRRERRLAMENIAMAFPDWSERRRETAIRRMFHHLGESMLELLWLPNLDARTLARTTSFENTERVKELIRAGRGIVTFTAHCGNWEWLGYAVASNEMPLTVLGRERREPEFNRFITGIRAGAGIRTIGRGSTGAAREMILALRRGGLLGFLIDQNIRAESVKVPFFGKPALTPIGAAKLAVRTESPVVCVFIERRRGKHIVRFNELIETRRNDDPVALTALITQEIEDQIRRVPEQWVWFHRRWRERRKWEVRHEV